MITGTITGLSVLQSIADKLKRLENPDLRPLGERIKGILINDNREALLAGVDGNGQPFAPLATSTQRQRRDSDLSGSWRADPSSVLISGFEVETTSGSWNGNAQILIGAGWNGTAPQARFFSEGTEHQPARKIDGIRPEPGERILKAVDEFANDLLNS